MFYVLSDVVLAWLSVWSEVQMTYIWSSWCQCHSVISAKIQNGSSFWYPGSPGQRVVKWL